MQNLILKALIPLLFPKNYKNFQKVAITSDGWGLCPQTPLSTIGLSCINFFTAPPQFNTYFKNINYRFISPLCNILFEHQPTPQASDLSIYGIFVPWNVPLLETFWWCRIACDLRFAPHQLKILAKPTPEVQEIFIFGNFPFYPIRNQCCPQAEDRTFSRTSRVRGWKLKLRGQRQGLQNVSSRTPPLIPRPIFFPPLIY